MVGKELPQQKVYLKGHHELDDRERGRIREFFETTLYPVMTPMAVDQGHPFPILPYRTLSFAVMLKGEKKHHLAILPIPLVIPRLRADMAARFSVGYRPPGTLCHPSRNARPGDEHECAAGAARALRHCPGRSRQRIPGRRPRPHGPGAAYGRTTAVGRATARWRSRPPRPISPAKTTISLI